MNWRDDSTATNVSLLAQWAYGVLRPIVRILRSAGVSQASLLEGVKRASAQHDGDARKGRLSPGSRYESLVGLSRVTAAWSRSSTWTDESGEARELSLRGNEPQSFAALVHSIDPRLNACDVLMELQRMEVVRILANRKAVRLLRHFVRTVGGETFSVEPVLRDLQRFAETLEHHIFRDRSNESRQMQITSARLCIDPGKFDDFCRFIARSGQLLLDSADDRLNSYRQVADGAGANFGVGVFVFCEDPPVNPPARRADPKDEPCTSPLQVAIRPFTM